MIHVWIAATRPKTLAASIAPVLLGSVYAFCDYPTHFSFPLTVLTILCAVLLQILANFTNEIGDFRRGADWGDRLGPERAVTSGAISYISMVRASAFVAITAFILGLIIVWYSSWIIFVVGILSLLCAWLYTGGPYPLAYRGLGEVFAVIFFGVIPVCGAYCIHAEQWSNDVFYASILPGLFAANILAVNNIRDRENDARVGKRTIATRVGDINARRLFVATMILTYTLVIILAIRNANFWLCLPLTTSYFAYRLSQQVITEKGSILNSRLAATGQLLVVFTVLFCAGVIVGNR